MVRFVAAVLVIVIDNKGDWQTRACFDGNLSFVLSAVPAVLRCKRTHS